MVSNASDYATQMVRTLAVTEPELDTSIGSPTRKIIDAVAEVSAAIDADRHLLDYIFDVDAKSGADLDDYLVSFGFQRFQAKRASGFVTFSRPSEADQDYYIPTGVQVSTASSPEVVFQTIVPAILEKGTTNVDVAVQAVLGGLSGNLGANTLTRLAQPVSGVSATTSNSAPTTGGANQETDEALRDRYKKTVFRSMAGTDDMYLGVALEDTTPDDPNDETATQAVVIGASRRWREQVQISGGEATSTIPVANSKYVFPDSSFVGTDLNAGSLLTPNIHYTFNRSVNPPKIVAVSGGLTEGGLYDLDFEYTPAASRNDPANGITNRIDVWVNGLRLVEATETVYFRTAQVFTNTSTDRLYASKFLRQDSDNVFATVGNYFLPLAYGPIEDFPDSLVVNGTTHTKGTHYWVVHDDTSAGYGPTSLFGIEWLLAHAPVNNQLIALSGGDTYIYNALPADVENRARRWRLTGTDVRAHAAKRVYLRFAFAVMYVPSFDQAQVDQAIGDAIQTYLFSRGFTATVQVSDIIQVAHEVDGVDNIRFLNSAEAVNGAYAIQHCTSGGVLISTYSSGGRPIDVIMSDNEIAMLTAPDAATAPGRPQVLAVAKAQNTYGTGS